VENLIDKDRPLNDRGKRDAPKMGVRLAKRDVKPDLILSSPATRAFKTAKIIAKELDYNLTDIVLDERLYAVGVDDLLDVVRGLGDKLERVMVVGHNPELTALAHRFSSEITHMPTCAVAEFTFDAKWWSNIDRPSPQRLCSIIQNNRRTKHRGSAICLSSQALLSLSHWTISAIRSTSYFVRRTRYPNSTEFDGWATTPERWRVDELRRLGRRPWSRVPGTEYSERRMQKGAMLAVIQMQ